MAHSYLGADAPSVLEQCLYAIPIIALCLAAVLALVRNRLFGPLPEHIDAVEAFRQHKHHDPLPIITQVLKLNPDLLPTHHNKRRLIILGDVHGCIDELHALLKHVSFSTKHDHLILAGDLINKGPSSSAVLSLVRSLNASCVRGNHEDKILRARAALFPPHTTSHGTSYTDTDTSSHPAPPAESGEGKRADDLARSLTQDEIDYIQSWPLILDLGALATLGYGHAAVVHAGLVPGIALSEQTPFAVMNMRAIKVHKTRGSKHGKGKHGDGHGHGDEETYTPSEDRDEGEKWHEVWAAAQQRLRHADRMLVVYGHDAKQGLVQREYSIGLDSACVRGERLSALVVEARGMRVESVKARKDYTAG